MNKTTATYNASDIWEVWLDKMLEKHPEYWVISNRKTKRKREFLYRRFKKKKDPVALPKEVMSFSRWLKIVNLYYLMARQEVVKGKRIRLGHKLGAIQARRVSRNFKNKQVNWGETLKQPYTINPETGRRKFEKMIYHTSETYCRIAWEKLRSITNESYYEFIPSQGGKDRGGFQRDFITALKENPLLETQYKQCTYELL